MASEPLINTIGTRRNGRRWIIRAIVVAVAVIGPFRFSWFSVCSRCGCVRYSTSRQLPLVPITYWTSHRIEQTVLSRQIAAFVPIHEHEWQFGQGGGNGIVCAIGPGRHINASTRSEQIAVFISTTHAYRGLPESLHWLLQAMDENRCRRLRDWLLDSSFPLDLSNSDAYEEWRSKAELVLPIYEPLTALATEPLSPN